MQKAQVRWDSVRSGLITATQAARTAALAELTDLRAVLKALRTPNGRHDAWRAARPLLWLLLGLLAFDLYVFSSRLPTQFTKVTVAPLYVPVAVILSVLLLTPPRRWWLYLAVAYLFQVALFTRFGYPLGFNLVAELPTAIEPLLVAYLLYRASLLPPHFARLREVTYFTVCVIAAAVLSAFMGATLRASLGFAFWPAWLSWFLGDSLANLVLVPAIVLWATSGAVGLRRLPLRRVLEIAVWCGLFVLVGTVAQNILRGNVAPFAIIYLPVPLLLWAAVRFHPRGVASALALLTVVVILDVTYGFGSFAGLPVSVSILTVQLFLAAIGVPLFFLAALVEEREEAQVEAERQAEELDRIIQTMADGVVVYDAQGRTVRTNAAAQQVIGMDAAPPNYADLSGEQRLLLFQTRDSHGRSLAPAELASQRALRGEVLTGASALDITARALDGSERDLNVSAAPLRDADGHTVGAVAIMRDQTERKRLERAVAVQAEQLERIVEGIGEGLFVYDTEGRVVRANASARRLLGLDAAPPDFFQLPAEERIARYASPAADAPLRELLSPRAWLGLREARDGDVLRVDETRDLHMRALDGRELEVSASVAPLHDANGALIGAVLLLSDRTERNQLAREKEAARASELALREVNARLDTFVAMAAHDLRSPVGVSKMVVQRAQDLLRKAAADVDGRASQGKVAQALIRATQAVETTAHSLNRLMRLVQQLLDVSRVKEGTLVLHCQPLDLAELVRTCVDEQRLLTPSRVMTLDLPDSAESGTPPVSVEADADRLSQVLTNYLANAVRYSPEDQPIEVGLQAGAPTTENASGRVVRVWVRDHGSGIPPEEQTTIWERFQRARSVHEAGGLGLGLYIARTMIDLHGGQVGVESASGQGATFWFTLPLGPGST